MTKILRLHADDWEQLKEIRLRALQSDPLAFGSTFERESQRYEEWWRERAQRVHWYLALDEPTRTTAGMIGCFPGEEDPMHSDLIAFWVDPAFRGTDVAQLLFHRVCTCAKEHGAVAVFFWATTENERAQGFYRKVGATVTGKMLELPDERGLREVQFTKHLV